MSLPLSTTIPLNDFGQAVRQAREFTPLRQGGQAELAGIIETKTATQIV